MIAIEIGCIAGGKAIPRGIPRNPLKMDGSG